MKAHAYDMKTQRTAVWVRTLLHTGILVVALFSGACTSIDKTILTEPDPIKLSEADIKEKLTAALARLETSDSFADLADATKFARWLYQRDRSNPQHEMDYYRLTSVLVLVTHNRAFLGQLRLIFDQSKTLASLDFDTPAVVEANMLYAELRGQRYVNQRDLDRIKDVLQRGLREKNHNRPAQDMLARLYSAEKHHELALSIYQQMISHEPDDPIVMRDYGYAHWKKAADNLCEENDAQAFEAAREALVNAVKRKPNDAETHRNLALVYEALGKKELYLFEAQRFNALANSRQSKLHYADALSANFRAADAVTAYTSLIEQEPDAKAIHWKLQRTYFLTGDWKNSIVAADKAQDSLKTPNPNANIAKSLAIWHMEGEAAARSVLEKQAASNSRDNWKQSVVSFLLRKTNETDLLSMAHNRCEKTEANLYIGYRHLLDEDLETAKKYFQRTVDIQFWGHFATTLALTRLNNSHSTTIGAVSAEYPVSRAEPTDTTQTGGN